MVGVEVELKEVINVWDEVVVNASEEVVVTNALEELVTNASEEAVTIASEGAVSTVVIAATHTASCVRLQGRASTAPASHRLQFWHTVSASESGPHALSAKVRPGAHALHGLQTVSCVSLHSAASYSSSTHAVQLPHTVSWVPLHARTPYCSPYSQRLHSWQCVALAKKWSVLHSRQWVVGISSTSNMSRAKHTMWSEGNGPF
jgi:hypothetical protein